MAPKVTNLSILPSTEKGFASSIVNTEFGFGSFFVLNGN